MLVNGNRLDENDLIVPVFRNGYACHRERLFPFSNRKPSDYRNRPMRPRASRHDGFHYGNSAFRKRRSRVFAFPGRHRLPFRLHNLNGSVMLRFFLFLGTGFGCLRTHRKRERHRNHVEFVFRREFRFSRYGRRREFSVDGFAKLVLPFPLFVFFDGNVFALNFSVVLRNFVFFENAR